jgi:hypothetical protein
VPLAKLGLEICTSGSPPPITYPSSFDWQLSTIQSTKEIVQERSPLHFRYKLAVTLK